MGSEELSNFPVFSSPCCPLLPFLSPPSLPFKRAAAKKPLQGNPLPFTLLWVRAFATPSLGAAYTPQIKAPGTQGALQWREELVTAREAVPGSVKDTGCGI